MYRTGPYIKIACLSLLIAGFVLPAYGQVSMFADPKARSVGDILTIILAERTAGGKTAPTPTSTVPDPSRPTTI